MQLTAEIRRSRNPLVPRAQRWRVTVRSRNTGNVLFVSSEGYANAAHAEEVTIRCFGERNDLDVLRL